MPALLAMSVQVVTLSEKQIRSDCQDFFLTAHIDFHHPAPTSDWILVAYDFSIYNSFFRFLRIHIIFTFQHPLSPNYENRGSLNVSSFLYVFYFCHYSMFFHSKFPIIIFYIIWHFDSLLSIYYLSRLKYTLVETSIFGASITLTKISHTNSKTK